MVKTPILTNYFNICQRYKFSFYKKNPVPIDVHINDYCIKLGNYIFDNYILKFHQVQ